MNITATYCEGESSDYDEDDEWDDFLFEHEDEYDTYEQARAAFDSTKKVLDYNTYTATAKCNLKCELYNSIRAEATLDDYNTRTNVFCMKVKNISNKTITIYSDGAAVYDDDYTSFDRRVKLTKGIKSITIKPEETKKIYFSVIGSTTWYNLSDFQLCSYWKWGEKKYWVSVDSGYEPYAKIKNKWKWIGHWTKYK